MNFVKTDGINALIAMGSTDGRVYSGQRQGARNWYPLSSAPGLTCIATRAEQRHTRGLHDNARCRLIDLEARSTVVVVSFFYEHKHIHDSDRMGGHDGDSSL